MTASKNASKTSKSVSPPLGADYWLGVDVAKKSFAVALAPCGVHPEEWRTLPVREFAHDRKGIDAMVAWIAERAPGRTCEGVCAESTGAYSVFFSDLLAATSLPPVSIVNPFRTVRFGQSLGARDKNDRVDAAILAVFGAIQRPAPAPRPDPSLRRLRELDRLRQSVLEDVARWENRLGQTSDSVARKRLDAILKGLRDELATIEKDIREIAEGASDSGAVRQIALLRSTPSIGPRIAVTLTAEFGDLSAYSRGELVARAGLFAPEHSSGTSVRRKPRMARGGGGRVRRVLFMGALSAMKSGTAIGSFAARLVAAGKPRMSVVGAVMRKLLLVARAVVVSGKPYDAALAARTESFRTPSPSASAA